MASDFLAERRQGGQYPPGHTGFSLSKSVRFIQDARGLLVECYERFGPVFTVRLLLNQSVFMVGPEANHYMTVSHASNFTNRESHFRDLVALVGDGMVTTDGDTSRRLRRMAMPAFHSESLRSHFAVMTEEIERSVAAIEPGTVVDIKLWANELMVRLGARTLFGFDPDGEQVRESGLASVLGPSALVSSTTRLLPGPVSSWNRMIRRVRQLDKFIYAEIAKRRAQGTGGTDVLSLLVAACDEDGDSLTDVQVRDQLLTLLLAGIGTTVSSICFLTYELARHPHVAQGIVAEQRTQLGDGELRVDNVGGEELVALEMAMDESLRMYPSVWIAPRRAVEQFEFAGVSVPAGAYVDYSPLASHYLPDLFPEPERFRPERFTPEAKAALPRGAYVPFGGGQRMCIGMRLAKLEIRTLATLLLRRFELSLPEDFSLSIMQVPMLVPKEGLPVMMRERARQGDAELAYV
jgi:cytochrome P450